MPSTDEMMPAILKALETGANCPICGRATAPSLSPAKAKASVSSHMRQAHKDIWPQVRAAMSEAAGASAGPAPRVEDPILERSAAIAEAAGIEHSRCAKCGAVAAPGPRTPQGFTVKCPECGWQLAQDQTVPESASEPEKDTAADNVTVTAPAGLRLGEAAHCGHEGPKGDLCQDLVGHLGPHSAFTEGGDVAPFERSWPQAEPPPFPERTRLLGIEAAAQAVVKRMVDPANTRCEWCLVKYSQMAGHFEGKDPAVRPCPIDVLQRALKGEETT